MKVFDDEDIIRRSIEFFNILSEQEKVTIVSDLNPVTFKLKQYHNRLAPLLSEVQRAISKHDDIAIGSRLVELGLDDTFARLFVSNIKKHAPTEAYQIHQISKIPDDVFSKSISEIIKSVWVEGMSEDEIAEKFNITKEQVQCIVDFSRTTLNALARGDITKDGIRNKYSDKLSAVKFESLSNSLLVHQKYWYDSLLFSNAQDSHMNLDLVARQNAAILKSLNEILRILRSEFPRRNRQGS